MGKKILLAIAILVLISLTAVFAFHNNTQDFDGNFEMKVPLGKEYYDVSYCLPNGRLGCAMEYWDVNSGCQMSEEDIVIYYYDDSLLAEGESDTWQHTLNTLTLSYLYKHQQNDGNLVILTNDIGMHNMPPYIVGVVNDDASKVVFVGGYNLDDLKYYANSVKFSWGKLWTF